jgi:hypothetical protein
MLYWQNYITGIRKGFQSYWKKYLLTGNYNAKIFSEKYKTPRDEFRKFCDENKLNWGSVAGIILEWTFTQFLIAGLEVLKKSDIAEVINGHQIPYIWKGKVLKKKGINKLNLDIVIKSKKTSKLFFAFEIKTNFEDGFDEYLEEEHFIYHQRTKTFPNFKFYYICLNKNNKNILNVKRKKGVNLLIKRKELYCISDVDNNDIAKDVPVQAFLKNIVNDLKSIK